MLRETFNQDCRGVLNITPTASVDGCFTDPPYNIALKPQRGTHGEIANDAMPPEQFRAFQLDVFREVYRVLKPNRVAWVCCNWECIDDFKLILTQVGFSIKNCVVWVKNNFGLGNHFRPQHEFILVAFKGEVPVPAEAISNVWNVARLNNTIHPTEKPVELIQKALRQYNKEGDIILDPFGGSLSTALAAKQLGMGYITAEIDEQWYVPGKMRLETGVVEMTNSKGKVVSRIEGTPLLDAFE